MGGRTVTVPAVIRSIYSTSPMGDIFLYTLAPDRAAGVSYNRAADELRFVTEAHRKLPVLGGWFGKSTTGNPEVIIKAKPDIVLSVGDHTGPLTADRLQEQLGIPVVGVDGELTKTDAAYRFVGDLIGERERAEVLASYCRRALDEVAAVAAAIPAEARVRVFYAEGSKGMETDPKGSQHTQVLDLAGGINVADVPMVRGYGRTTVSFEQVLVWKPDLVIVCVDRGYADGTGSYGRIIADPTWQTVDAIKSGRVYEIPSLPHNWFDRPPSVNRVIGLIWLTNLLYPDRYQIDIRAKAAEFYELFYHRTLSAVELDEVLEHATRH
jgi:iron complex transport system substrate-binding protein